MRVLCVFGTRPEAIKMAPVIKELRRRSSGFSTAVCVTAQHREMLDQVLSLFQVQPDFDLNLMRDDQSLASFTADALTGLDRVIMEVKPDLVLAQGDTTTSMVATLAAFYHRIRIGHVEAGLRTWNRFHPFPEEINRKIADAVCDYHFAPTNGARENLLREGVEASSIIVTGNTVIDALLEVSALPYDWNSGPLSGIPRDRRLILVTAHRRENFGGPLASICTALREIAERRPEMHIVFPVHLNPNVQRMVYERLEELRNVSLTEPLDYLPLVNLMKQCYLVLTDSGGLQEEAPALGKPVAVLREVTERPEGIAAGTVKLVGTDTRRIVEATLELLDDPVEYEQMSRAVNPYGDGHASQRTVDFLEGLRLPQERAF